MNSNFRVYTTNLQMLFGVELGGAFKNIYCNMFRYFRWIKFLVIIPRSATSDKRHGRNYKTWY